MILELLDRSALTLISRTLGYPLAVAEKDYLLAIVSKIIHDSPLGGQIVFKGGTALHHVYLPQLRFSEDLDFSVDHGPITLEAVGAIFNGYDFLSVKKSYRSSATVKIERLLYNGPLGQPNSLKVEVDFLQNVVLPPREMEYRNAYGVATKVRVMDIREIAAEKIRAMNDRIRYRDFYDFAVIGRRLGLDLDEVIALVRQKELRQSISRPTILANWQLAKADRVNELSAVHYAEALSSAEVEEQLERLQFDPIIKSPVLPSAS